MFVTGESRSVCIVVIYFHPLYFMYWTLIIAPSHTWSSNCWPFLSTSVHPCYFRSPVAIFISFLSLFVLVLLFIVFAIRSCICVGRYLRFCYWTLEMSRQCGISCFSFFTLFYSLYAPSSTSTRSSNYLFFTSNSPCINPVCYGSWTSSVYINTGWWHILKWPSTFH
jgi:hypothetical protein